MACSMTNTRRISSLFLALVLASLSIISAISNQNHEILDLLKRLNKPAIKSIKSSDGDIIDCVKIEDQPAFDHPLLKNHTIEGHNYTFRKVRGPYLVITTDSEPSTTNETFLAAPKSF
ncbi:hypothetical protein ACFE04_004207 [Oxalis oulophora]